MLRPAVSVMIPCYQASRSLPTALSSLLAQTWTDWECILVEDGSADAEATRAVVGRAKEALPAGETERFRLIPLSENRGRGFARQVALDEARGEFLAILDADDWWYPEKLRRQLQVLDDHPEAVLVSTGMTIVDAGNELVGVRRYGSDSEAPARLEQPMPRPSTIPIPHAPSLIRMPNAKACRYDPNLDCSEDFDFLLQLLLRHPYAVLPGPSYVYEENPGQRGRKFIENFRMFDRILGKYRNDFPLAVLKECAAAALKSAAYQGIDLLGLGRRIWEIQNESATPAERENFLAARRTVLTRKDAVFG